MAAGARAVMEAHQMRPTGAYGSWARSLDLVRAGVQNPRQAIADLRRAGVEVDEAVINGFVAWRLREQLSDERDAEGLRRDE
jgi:hypothetical protein